MRWAIKVPETWTLMQLNNFCISSGASLDVDKMEIVFLEVIQNDF